MHRKTVIVFVLVVLLGSGSALGQVGLRFDLSGDQEVPPVNTEATGHCVSSLNYDQTNFFISCENNVTDVTGAHIHEAAAGQDGPIIFFFDASTSFSAVVNEHTLSSNGNQSQPLNMSQFVDQLIGGNLYVNVHSIANPSGEVRGQIPPPPFFTNFPQFGNGEGFTSSIVLLNTTTTGSPAVGNVLFFDEDGQLQDFPGSPPSSSETFMSQETPGFEVPPLGSLTLTTDGMGEIVVGSLVVAQTGGSDSIGASVIFNIEGLGTVGLGSSEPIMGGILAVQNSGGTRTGVAIRNESPIPITVEYSLRQDGVEVADGSASLDLGVNARDSRFVDEIFPDLDLTNFGGTLVISSDFGFSASALQLGTNPGEFTFLSVVPIP